MIDLALAGDNAVAVGLSAAGLPETQRRKAAILGLAGAVVMLIGFALLTVQLLNMVGLLLAGLLISVTLMGVAATWTASLRHRFRWLAHVGLAIVFSVALHMIWEGHRSVVVDLGEVSAYNAALPAPLAITPDQVAAHQAGRN
ncbi:hypothetical protein [Phenylobacterium sp.]|uniref:TerC family protein n=1 Tax=Phenylobacterium sp. TaxID=1871053 RepID=UPI0027271C77|nr:hypothetical protein [Phenylobacterium sp.]MDO8802490.1 hypothetical protein [Phenylobacterium sp.]